MKVSVIIPTHNRILQLQRAYNSVCNQTRIPEEIIIIDDASDNIVAESLIIKSDREITTIIHRFETSQGACQARNQGAAIASGDILMFLDDDDTWEQNKIHDQLKVFASNNQIGLVYSGKLIVKESERDKILYKVKPKVQGNLYPEILYDNLIGSTSSVAIKKQLFDDVAGFDIEIPALQDYDLWIRCCQKTLVGHDNSYNLRYTIADQPEKQITGQTQRQIEAVQIILNKYQTEITSQGFINTRKIYASKNFYISKSLRHKNFFEAIPWMIKSFLQYPNMKIIALFFPVAITHKLRNIFY